MCIIMGQSVMWLCYSYPSSEEQRAEGIHSLAQHVMYFLQKVAFCTQNSVLHENSGMSAIVSRVTTL